MYFTEISDIQVFVSFDFADGQDGIAFDTRECVLLLVFVQIAPRLLKPW